MFRRFALVALAFAAAPAHADNGVYIGANLLGGFTQQDNVRQLPVQTGTLSDSTDNAGMSGGIGGTIGYDLKNHGLPLALELAANWRYRHDLDIEYTNLGTLHAAKLDVMTVDTMLSLLWFIPTGTSFTPYLGAGGGMVYSDIDNVTQTGTTFTNEGNTDDWEPAWQLQAGFNYALSPRWDVRFDYRYIDMGTVNSARMSPTASTFEADLSSHDLRLGVLYKF